MINVLEKKDCCGCSACKNICPKNCILMKEDEEGFLYPVVEYKKCIKCGLCIKTCPIINKKKKENEESKGFVVQHLDKKILSESTSGGAFTSFATSIILRGGIVFGAAMNKENYCVSHVGVESLEKLSIFRGSKYVQSDPQNVFNEIKKELECGRLVLFSGMACQVEGLLNYLGKDYENLFTVDLVCRAVPSPLVFKKYMEYQTEKYGKEIEIRFRDKRIYGYNYSNLSIKKEDRYVYNAGIERDPYLQFFFKGYCNRPSCSACSFKSATRRSDITIWDCFDVRNFNKELDNNLGVTKVLIHSKKGIDLFENSVGLKSVEIPVDLLISSAHEMINSTSDSKIRKEFMRDAAILNGRELVEKYSDLSIKVKIISLIKKICIKTGVYSLLKAKKYKSK